MASRFARRRRAWDDGIFLISQPFACWSQFAGAKLKPVE
jgi:hypothetical protein